MQASQRLQRLPRHLFAQLEWKAATMRAEGIDVISLGIGDPDTPTYAPIVAAGRRALADAGTHHYPTNRGRSEFRGAVAAFYSRRFGVELDPAAEVIPALGAKECIFNVNLAFLDPGDVALVPDPGYPIYTAGPLLVGAEAELVPLRMDQGYIPDLTVVSAAKQERARLLYLNYPNTPTGAVVPDGFFEEVVDFAHAADVLVVHDNVYSEITFDGYVAPSFLATPGAREVGVEIFSLSKAYNMTGWRCAAMVGNAAAIEAYRTLKTNVDSGNFDAVQLAGAAALDPAVDPFIAEMRQVYARRRDLACVALRTIGFDITPPKGTIYVWSRIPPGFESSGAFCNYVLEQTAVVLSPGSAYGPNGEGFFRISLTAPDAQLLQAIERLQRLAL